MPRSQNQLDNDRSTTLAATGDGSWTSTTEIAENLKRDRSHVMTDLKWLENRDLVVSKSVPSSRTLFYCIDCDEVVTADTYESCRDNKHELRPFHPQIRVWKRTIKGRRAVHAGLSLAA